MDDNMNILHVVTHVQRDIVRYLNITVSDYD